MAKTSEVLKSIMQERDITQGDIAKAAGVSRQAVQQWCSGRTAPRGSALAKLAEFLNLSPAVIQYGPLADAERRPGTVEIEDGVICIPQFEESGSCGHGFENGGYLRAMVCMVKVTLEWIRSLSPFTNPRHLEVITARGDSMEPTIRNLDFVFVDRSYTTVEEDGVYVVTYAGTTYIKRAQKQFDGSLLLTSDNDIYRPMTIPASELDRVVIEGKCAIFCKASASAR